MVYGRQPFGLPALLEQDYDVKVNMSEQLGGSLPRLGLNHAVSAGLSEKLSGAGHLKVNHHLYQRLGESLSGNAAAVSGAEITADLQETLDGAGHAGSNIYINAAASENLGGSAKLRRDAVVAANIEEMLRGAPPAPLLPDFPRLAYGPQPFGRILEILPVDTVHVNKYVYINELLREDFVGDAHASKNIHITQQFDEKLLGTAFVAMGTEFFANLQEVLSGEAKLRRNRNLAANLLEELNAAPPPATLPDSPRMAFGIQPFGRILELPPQNAIHMSKNVHLTETLLERLLGAAHGFTGVIVKADIRETLTGSAIARRNWHIISKLLESLSSDGHLSKNVYPTATLREVLTGAGHLSKNVYVVSSLTEMLTGKAHLSKHIHVMGSLYEILLGYADVRELEERTTIILGDIPAGAMLMIDAENCIMTLQQGSVASDVTHMHRGAWLWINRGTSSITAAGIGSNYTVEVMYRALYL